MNSGPWLRVVGTLSPHCHKTLWLLFGFIIHIAAIFASFMGLHAVAYHRALCRRLDEEG